LGIPTVATVSWTTDQVLRRLLPAEQPHDWIDPSARVSLVERVLPARWGGKKLAPLNEPGRFVLAAVTRLGTAQIAGAKLVGQEGDVLHFVVDVTALDALRERLEHGPEA
jgi:trk system potassium uptake protein TrkA